MVRVPTAAGSANSLGELLKTPGAMTLLEAYAAIKDPRQRAALVGMAWAPAEQARAREGRAEADQDRP